MNKCIKTGIREKQFFYFPKLQHIPFSSFSLDMKGTVRRHTQTFISALVERFNQTSQLIQRDSVLLYVRITRASTGMQTGKMPTKPGSRTGCIICEAQCQMKMLNPLFKKSYKF